MANLACVFWVRGFVLSPVIAVRRRKAALAMSLKPRRQPRIVFRPPTRPWTRQSRTFQVPKKDHSIDNLLGKRKPLSPHPLLHNVRFPCSQGRSFRPDLPWEELISTSVCFLLRIRNGKRSSQTATSIMWYFANCIFIHGYFDLFILYLRGIKRYFYACPENKNNSKRLSLLPVDLLANAPSGVINYRVTTRCSRAPPPPPPSTVNESALRMCR